MREKKSFCFVLFILIVSTQLLLGCAAFKPKQEGNITSEPSGASIWFYEGVSDKISFIGCTPTNAWVQQGAWTTWLVAEMPGYETERWLLPEQGSISHHFLLQRDISMQIHDEKDIYDKEYIKKIIDVLGKCEKVLHSPRMLAGQAASEAKTEYQKLKIDDAKFDNSAVDKAISRLVEKAINVSSLPSSYYNTSVERTLVKEIDSLISKIRNGLGL